VAEIPARASKLADERVVVLAGEGPDAALLDRAVTFRDLVALGLVSQAAADARARQRPAMTRRTEGAQG
jgi:hypothetical protein